MLPRKWAVRVINNTGVSVNVVVDGTITNLDGTFDAQSTLITNAALANGGSDDSSTATETEAPAELNGIMKATPSGSANGTLELFLLTENDGNEKPSDNNGFTLRTLSWVTSEGAVEKRTNYRHF